jgi:YjbE family integral membrane protein
VSVVDPAWWGSLLLIAGLNLLLSGDNALVIALAVRNLPRRQRILGQVWGAVGAVVLRLAFVGIVTKLFNLRFVQFVGGVLLVWIALKLVQADEGDSEIQHGTSFLHAVWIIVVADVTMSLDNVLAVAAAAKGEIALTIIGVGLSLPVVIWGAGLLATLMNRYPWIVWLGGGVLGFVAGDMALKDPGIVPVLGGAARWLHHGVAWGLAAIITAFGWWRSRHRAAHRVVA